MKTFCNRNNAFNEIPLALRSICEYTDKKPENPKHILCFKNCLYNLETHSTQPHDPHIIFTKYFDYDYIEYNKDFKKVFLKSRFRKFLFEIIPNKQERRILQEYAGYTFNDKLKYQKSIIFIGNASNGKSTLLIILKELFGGDQNVSSLELTQLTESRFALSSLINKIANIAPDISSDHFNENVFKCLVSGDRIKYEDKYEKIKSFVNKARFYLSCNEFPKIKDKTNAVWRRILIINFPTIFCDEPKLKNEKKINRFIIEELIVELGIIFQWAMCGLKGIENNKGFSKSSTIEDRVNEYKKIQNPLYDFYFEKLESDKNSLLKFKIVYEKYLSWCLMNNIRYQVSRKKFFENLFSIDENIKKEVHGQNIRYIKGIKFRELNKRKSLLD